MLRMAATGNGRVWPADVELFKLTAGGLLEQMAEWSEAGPRNVVAAMEKNLSGRDAV
jgi:hypothetical protein